ncbi:MAG TPA: hypothetical protein VEK57_09910 [Thermoanaerobaculia bacterium]|nr:hypothetical protein [Thermoanaerobaculia bacterium]
MPSAPDDPTQDPRVILEIVRALKARIPDYTHMTPAQTITLRRAASLDREWIIHAIATAGASEAVQMFIGKRPPELLDELSADGLWVSVEQELSSVLDGVIAAKVVRRHRLGLIALQIYGISRQLIRQKEHEALIPYVEKLQQSNKLGKRKKVKEEGAANE